MTTLATQSTLAASLKTHPIDAALIGYFHAYSQDQAFEAVWDIFEPLSEANELTRAEMAKRLNKKPEQITRWLSAPGNWTLLTYGELLLSMGYVPTYGARKIDHLPLGNYRHPATYSSASFPRNTAITSATTTANAAISFVIQANRGN